MADKDQQAINDALDAYAQGATTGNATPSGPPHSADKDTQGIYDAIDVYQRDLGGYGSPPSTAPTGQGETYTPVPNWGPGHEMMSSFLMRQGVPAYAVVAAAREGMTDFLNGASFGDALQSALHRYYPQARDIYASGQQQYVEANPRQSIGANVVGGAAGALPALMIPEEGMIAGGNALARAFPSAAEAAGPAARFIAGYGGESIPARAVSSALMGARQAAT